MKPKINNREMSDQDYIKFLELSNAQKSEEINKYQIENPKLRFLILTGENLDLEKLKK